MNRASEPSETVVKTLFALSRNVCAFRDPERGIGCEEKLTDPSWRRVRARICHISGYAPTSARFDPLMTDEQRNSFDNLLLLCPNHHVLVDDLEPDRFSTECLQNMKQSIESSFGGQWATDDRLSLYSSIVIASMRPEWADLATLAALEAEFQRAVEAVRWFDGAPLNESVDDIEYRAAKQERRKLAELRRRRSEMLRRMGVVEDTS